MPLAPISRRGSTSPLANIRAPRHALEPLWLEPSCRPKAYTDRQRQSSFSAGEHMLHDGPDQFDGPRWIATAYPGSTLFRKGAVFVATCLCAATVHALSLIHI